MAKKRKLFKPLRPSLTIGPSALIGNTILSFKNLNRLRDWVITNHNSNQLLNWLAIVNNSVNKYNAKVELLDQKLFDLTKENKDLKVIVNRLKNEQNEAVLQADQSSAVTEYL